MILAIPAPGSLNRTAIETDIPPEEAFVLTFIDLNGWPGRVRRGRGCSRADDVTGAAATITACGFFERRDCRKILIDADTAGNIRVSVGQGYYGLIDPPCVGPVPELLWDSGDNENGIPSGSGSSGGGGDGENDGVPTWKTLIGSGVPPWNGILPNGDAGTVWCNPIELLPGPAHALRIGMRFIKNGNDKYIGYFTGTTFTNCTQDAALFDPVPGAAGKNAGYKYMIYVGPI